MSSFLRISVGFLGLLIVCINLPTEVMKVRVTTLDSQAHHISLIQQTDLLVESLLINITHLAKENAELKKAQNFLRMETATSTTTASTTTSTIRTIEIPMDNIPTTHPEWCPKAKCTDTAICKPCQRRWLIVVTSPRSASTTLTWMLDELPGVTMAGENNGALGHLRTFDDQVVRFENFLKGGYSEYSEKNKGAWGHHESIKQGQACAYQLMMRNLNPPFLHPKNSHQFHYPEKEATEIAGFKTIRFFEPLTTPDQEQQMLHFLDQNFPCAKYIFNINSDVEHEAKSISKLFHENKGLDRSAVIQKVETHLEQAKRFARMLGPDRAYLLDKVEWTSGNMTYINRAIRWLGFHESCQFEELLEYNTAKAYKATKTTTKPFPPTCVAL
jgi:hypothetical protein